MLVASGKFESLLPSVFKCCIFLLEFFFCTVFFSRSSPTSKTPIHIEQNDVSTKMPNIKRCASVNPHTNFRNDKSSFFRSSSFDFIMGENKTRLTIHKDVLRRLSAPLAAMMDNGRMKESLEGCAILAHVEEDTFLGFSEFAYQGRYLTPKHTESDVQGRASTSVKS